MVYAMILHTQADQLSTGKGPVLLELFPWVILNGFLYTVYGLCLCYDTAYTG